MIVFGQPTLITLTSPSCGGKSWLMEHLIAEWNFQRIISTTDRAPRVGEVDKVHYFFMTTEESKELEKQKKFAELVTYNGVRYGVTHDEMVRKVAKPNSAPPIVILEPSGLKEYEKYCKKNKWRMFKIFVDTPEEIRILRLADRTTKDIIAKPNASYEEVKQCIMSNNNRLQAIIEKERSWYKKSNWDLIVPGTSLSDAKHLILDAAKRFNND